MMGDDHPRPGRSVFQATFSLVLQRSGRPGFSATPSDPDAVEGKLQFETKCLACHSIGQGPKVGPDLAGVTMRRTDAWLARWLKSPETMLADDDTAKVMLKRYQLAMPNQNLTEGDIRKLMKYFHWVDANARPRADSTRHEGTR